MAAVTIAPIQARATGTYRTGQRALPAGVYSEITIQLINALGGTDFSGSVDFVEGDSITGKIEFSEDGGVTWQDLIILDPPGWQGGHPGPRGGVYTLTRSNVTIAVPSVYRAVANVVSSDTVTFGVQALVTLAP